MLLLLLLLFEHIYYLSYKSKQVKAAASPMRETCERKKYIEFTYRVLKQHTAATEEPHTNARSPRSTQKETAPHTLTIHSHRCGGAAHKTNSNHTAKETEEFTHQRVEETHTLSESSVIHYNFRSVRVASRTNLFRCV